MGSPIGGKSRVRPVVFAGLVAALVAAAAAFILHSQFGGTEAPAVVAAHHVGSSTCKNCHASEFKAWKGSHHDLAMQDATDSSVLGNFNDAKHQYHDVETTFFKRDGKFVVRTDGPDGKLADYVVKYVFGITPLQQYLIEFPGGRLQALSIAWDTRSKADGGQRWFYLYPHEKIDHTDALHWTGLYQNWNLQCASCHSTNLRKNYDPVSNAYQTTWSEMNVSCEACHGPGSRHVTWAKQAKPPYRTDDVKALETYLKSGWDEAWRFPSGDAKYAVRDKFPPNATMNVCWPCHSRRSVQKEGGAVDAALLEAYRPAPLTPPLYHADGQQRDEVYTWGSYLQSKMYQRGVTCMDCHEPHALKLRAEGNALCGRCHNATVFDTKLHHRHEMGSKGAACVSCHMPAQNYMVVDARHDHSFRIPRPDVSAAVGSPDACTQCHSDRTPEWATTALDQWHGNAWRSRPHYGTAIHAGLTLGAKGLPTLIALAQDTSQPNIVRTAAVSLAQRFSGPRTSKDASLLLNNVDPSLRIAAIGLAEGDRGARVRLIAPLLVDPVRGVRIEAGRALADASPGELGPGRTQDRDRAVREYEDSLQLDADWPTATINLGNLRRRQGRLDEAKAAYERALALDARFSGTYVNLADLFRQQAREQEGEKILRQGLQLLPKAADLHHALGLLLVRRGDKANGVAALAEAAKLAPENSRFAYVYAIGLFSSGRVPDALAVLRDADRRNPYDLDILSALVSIQREIGDKGAALVDARKIAEVLPGDPVIARLITELEGR